MDTSNPLLPVIPVDGGRKPDFRLLLREKSNLGAASTGTPMKYTPPPRAVPTSRVRSRSSWSALTYQPSSPGLHEVKRPSLIRYTSSPRISTFSACPRATTGAWLARIRGARENSGCSMAPVESLSEYLSDGPLSESPPRWMRTLPAASTSSVSSEYLSESARIDTSPRVSLALPSALVSPPGVPSSRSASRMIGAFGSGLTYRGWSPRPCCAHADAEHARTMASARKRAGKHDMSWRSRLGCRGEC